MSIKHKRFLTQEYSSLFLCQQHCAVDRGWRLSATLRQQFGLPTILKSMHRLRMALYKICSKYLALPSKWLNPPINGRNADFSFLSRSRIECDATEYSRTRYDAASVQSGDTSLLRLHNGENIAENGRSSISMHWLRSKWRKLHAYRVGVLVCAGATATVCLINLIFTMWAWKTLGVNAGFGTIQRGNCDQTKKLSLWLHLAINFLSTLLLSASNYTMQCLSSPTRQDIDKAHAQNKWLDIGVPSVRNLKRIGRKRIIIWGLLAITSLPLHLMYNSAVFDTLSIYRYDVFIVSKDFSSGAPFNVSARSPIRFSSPNRLAKPGVAFFDPILLEVRSADFLRSEVDAFRISSSDVQLKNLTTRDCILAYGNVFGHSNYKNVLAVSSVNNATNSLLGLGGNLFLDNHLETTPERELWCCEGHEDSEGYCKVDEAANHAHKMTFNGHPIDYCRVQEVDEDCMLQFSLPIMLVVIICNLIKTACMVCVALGELSQPLVVIGDAIASFLRQPDPRTQNICLAGKDSFRRGGFQKGGFQKGGCENGGFQKGGWQARPLTWKAERHRWFRAASMTRWLVCNVL